MVHDPGPGRSHDLWAQLRFAVVGPLLAAPPKKGELKSALAELAAKDWLHPTRKEPVRFAFSTVERWLYVARKTTDPVGRLRRRTRQDAGTQPSLSERLRQRLLEQYQAHKSWSVQLHADNLAVLVEKDPSLGRMPSYSSVRRYMKAHGLTKVRRRGPRTSRGADQAERRLESLEVRSYEAEYVHGLFHTDFHSGSLKVLTSAGEWRTPVLLAVMDDRSRLCCHAQWYLAEDTASFVHGLSQALQKRGLPRALMHDRGAPMMAAETTQGLARLSVQPEPTLPYSPYQNAKQECFWGQVEGRLMAMLEGVANDLTLALLNEATCAWLELEYNREVHSETGEPPLQRFLAGPDVGRPCPGSETLRAAFTMEETRAQRRSDGTILVEGVRFEVPSRFRHLERIAVRYARWDLSYVLCVDARSGAQLDRLWPLDKTKNAEGRRRPLAPITATPATPTSGLAPLLEKLMQQQRDSGLPPAYVPKDDSEEETR